MSPGGGGSSSLAGSLAGGDGEEENQLRLLRVRTLVESLEEEEDKNRQKKKFFGRKTSSRRLRHKQHRRGAAMSQSVSIPKLGGGGVERIVRSVEYLKLRARNMLYGRRCRLAMGWLNLALLVVRPSSLGGLGSLHYLRGKIYQKSNFQHVDGLALLGAGEEGGVAGSDDDEDDEEETYGGLGRDFSASSTSSASGASGGGTANAKEIARARSVDMYVRGVDAYQRAGHYFRAVDDNHRQVSFYS
jgi:hypothetical protein